MQQLCQQEQQLQGRLEETSWCLCQKNGEMALLKSQLKDAAVRIHCIQCHFQPITEPLSLSLSHSKNSFLKSRRHFYPQLIFHSHCCIINHSTFLRYTFFSFFNTAFPTKGKVLFFLLFFILYLLHTYFILLYFMVLVLVKVLFFWTIFPTIFYTTYILYPTIFYV